MGKFNEPKLYVEEGSLHAIHAQFMSDTAYAEALDALVIVCTDAVFINCEYKTLYLTRRKAKPMVGFWITGGRTKAGETPVDSVRRCVKRETSLDVAPERFSFVRLNRYWWKDRQQEPQNHGCDTFAYVFMVELRDDEIAQAKASLDPDEYDTTAGLQEFDLKRLRQENTHPMLIDLYHDIFSKKP